MLCMFDYGLPAPRDLDTRVIASTSSPLRKYGHASAQVMAFQQETVGLLKNTSKIHSQL